jgi:hypothetical protein
MANFGITIVEKSDVRLISEPAIAYLTSNLLQNALFNEPRHEIVRGWIGCADQLLHFIDGHNWVFK